MWPIKAFCSPLGSKFRKWTSFPDLTNENQNRTLALTVKKETFLLIFSVGLTASILEICILTAPSCRCDGRVWVKWSACLLSRCSPVWLFPAPWTTAHQAPLWHFPGKNTGGGYNALLHRIFSTQGSNHVSWVSCLAGRFFYCWATRAAPANRAAENRAARQRETGSLVLLLVTVIIILLFYWSIIHWTNLQRPNKYICTYLEICIRLCYHHSDHNIDNFKGSDGSLMPLPG